MLPPIPAGWSAQLQAEAQEPYFQDLQRFLEQEHKAFKIYPPEEDTFQALELTPFNNVNVLLLGQDPYPGPNQAHGLSFSVRPGVPIPASLKNIYKELADEYKDFRAPNNGFLVPWARQGILMLNTLLTVRDHQPNSHKGHWEKFTTAIIESVKAKPSRVVFVLWGKDAQKLIEKVDPPHKIVKAAHPSPLSAKRFFETKSFSLINQALKEAKKPEIDWQIPDV
jgi:uracil-DNA glycosylase